MPLVTVLMSVYNGMDYLSEAIESILAQTLDDFEFIIINDGSIDKSKEIILSYKDPRIFLLDLSTNIGLPKALNKGLEISQCEYIARMDADDISLYNRLQKQYFYIKQHPEVGVLGTGIRIIDESKQIVGKWIPPKDNNLIVWSLLFSNSFAHSSVMFRRSEVMSVKGYRSVETEDFDLWSRLSGKTKFSNLQEELLLYRNHSVSKTKKEPIIHSKHSLLVMQNSIAELLQRPMTENEIVCLDKLNKRIQFESKKDLFHSTKLIYEIYGAFLHKFDISIYDRQQIFVNIGRQLALISESNYGLSPSLSRLIMMRAIVHCPRLLLSKRFMKIFF